MIKKRLGYSFIILAVLIFFLSMIRCFRLSSRQSGSVRAALSSDSIGQTYSKTENGDSVVGVKIKADRGAIDYAYDVWKYTQANGWTFRFADLYGDTMRAQEETDDGEYLDFQIPIGWDGRVMVHGKRLYDRFSVNPCFMVETSVYQKGESLESRKEYSLDTSTWSNSQDSLMKAMMNQKDMGLAGNTADGKSYVFFIHSGKIIGEDGGFAADPNGGSIQKEGEAYYHERNSDGSVTYQVYTLPEAVKERDRNVYILKGWYTQKEGGSKVSQGDIIPEGTKLYAQWEAVYSPCTVECVDVLKVSGSNDTVLGTSYWEADYGDTVYGSQSGSDTSVGKYYGGREYTGCSQAVVSDEGTKVYRYFKNSMMTVQCIDEVSTGPDAGQQLGKNLWQAEYTSTVSGSVQGDDTEVGAYYKGYRFHGATSQKVGESGCTVYRYFTPIKYNIEFVSNCSSEGTMGTLKDLYYGHAYSLTRNAFSNKKKLTFSLGQADATCDTMQQSVYLDFAGWSAASDGGVLYSDGYNVRNLRDTEGTVKLYAVWREKEITIDVQPKCQGYEFIGWSEEEEGAAGKKQFQVNEDMTLYAVWKAIPVSYHVEYYKQKIGSGYELAARYDFTGITGSLVSTGEVGEDLYPGFYLDEESSKLSGEVKADGTLILSVYFNRGRYTLDFDANGGSIVSGQENLQTETAPFEQAVTLEEVELKKTGYDFGGWTVRRDEKPVVAWPGEEYMIPNHDQTLFAYWIPRTDTKFEVIPYIENVNGSGYMKAGTLEMEGTTDTFLIRNILEQNPDMTIEDIFRELLNGGYQLRSDEILSATKVSSQGDTSVDVYFTRDRFEVRFLEEGIKPSAAVVATQEAVYGQSYILPESFQGITDIFCYRDEEENLYYPGDLVEVYGNQTFVLSRRSEEELPQSTEMSQETEPIQTPESATQKPESIRTPEPVQTPGDSIQESKSVQTPEPARTLETSTQEPETVQAPETAKTSGTSTKEPESVQTPESVPTSEFSTQKPGAIGTPDPARTPVTSTQEPESAQSQEPTKIPEASTQKPEDAQMPEPARTPDTSTQESESAQSQEPAKIPGSSTQELETVQTPASAPIPEASTQEPESVRTPEPVRTPVTSTQESESAQTPEPVRTPATSTEESESVQTPESALASEFSTQMPEDVRISEPSQILESSTQEPESARTSESIQMPVVVQTPESTQPSETIQPSGVAPTPEMIQSSEPLQTSEFPKDAVMTDSTLSPGMPVDHNISDDTEASQGVDEILDGVERTDDSEGADNMDGIADGMGRIEDSEESGPDPILEESGAAGNLQERGSLGSLETLDTDESSEQTADSQSLDDPAIAEGSLAADVTEADRTLATEGNLAVISDWTGSDSSLISSKLAGNADAIFLKKGKIIKKNGIRYKVLKTGKAKRTLMVVGMNKAKKTVTIPDQIKWEGYTYRVQKIRSKALYQKKKIRKIVLGKYIKKIGKHAFANCKKLSLINIRSVNIKKIQKGAWTGCSKNLQISFGIPCKQKSRIYVMERHIAMTR